jgi:hypothetical protein
MTDSGAWLEVAVGVLAIAVTGILGYYLLLRLRAQRLKIMSDLSSSPVFANDRAFNQIRIARSELELLQRDGHDLPRAGELIDRAETLLGRSQNVEAVRLALDAHHLLVEARKSGSTSGSQVPSSTSAHPAATPATGGLGGTPSALLDPNLGASSPGTGLPSFGSPSSGPASSGEALPTRPPKNRMEAHFQMTLLVEELGKNPSARGWAAAEGLRALAQKSYSDTQYTEALRLALRGRRALGVRLETLSGGPAVAAPASGATNAPAPSTSGGPERTCPQCGRPIRSNDRFCRGCGATNAPSECPRCRAELGASDTFCGRCGSPVS